MKPSESCSLHRPDSTDMHQSCLSVVPIFNHLSEAQLSDLAKSAKSLQIKKGELLYRAGELSSSLYIVHKGLVKVYQLSEAGKETLYRILRPGDFTGELALFMESEHNVYAEALQQTEVCMIARADLQQHLLQHPTVSLRILSEFSARLANSQKQVSSLATESVEARIALYFADLMEETNTATVQLPMTRKNLASYLGTTPETISRKLTEFEEAGWIQQISPRKLRIIDLDALLLL